MSFGNPFHSVFANHMLNIMRKMKYRDYSVRMLLVYLIDHGIEFEKLHQYAAAARMANDMMGDKDSLPDEVRPKVDELCRVLYGEQE